MPTTRECNLGGFCEGVVTVASCYQGLRIWTGDDEVQVALSSFFLGCLVAGTERYSGDGIGAPEAIVEALAARGVPEEFLDDTRALRLTGDGWLHYGAAAVELARCFGAGRLPTCPVEEVCDDEQ